MADDSDNLLFFIVLLTGSTPSHILIKDNLHGLCGIPD